MTNKTIFTILAVIVLVAAGYFGWQYTNSDDSNAETDLFSYDQDQNNNNNQGNNQVTDPIPTPPAENTQAPEQAIVKFETSEGSFKVALDGKAAPQTVNNFIKLAKEGFYDGLVFHRIVEGFMIQGGDPKGDGTGGPGYTVPAEIGLKHTKGAIAMARLGDQINPKKDSSGSQFYITLEAQPMLDGQYTVFGHVSEGMNTIEKIGATPVEPNPMTGEPSVPLKEVKIIKVSVESES